MLRIVPFFLLFLLGSCIPPPEFPAEEPCESEAYHGVFILNEGVWTQNNARLDVWDGENSCQGIFEEVNESPLGDVANFALVDQDTLFLIINNSRLLYKVQLPSMKLLASLSFPEGASPREITRISAHQAFVTSFHTAELYEIDPSSMQITDSIAVENSMEGIISTHNKLFIACGNHPFDGKNNKLAVIDLATKAVRYVALPYENPGDLALFEDQILISCKGDFNPNGAGSALVIVDALTESVQETIHFEGTIFDIEEANGQLFVIRDSAIARLELRTGVLDKDYLPKSHLTSDDKDLIYCMAFDKTMGELYIGMAPFGAVDGEVLRLDPFQRILAQKKAGLYPAHIFFYR